MIKFNAYVIELEADTWYKVCIEDIITTVCDNGYFDDTVSMLFRLITVIDIK